MASLRVVVYAEGPGDAGGEVTELPPPNLPLGEEHLGAVHVLVRRCLSEQSPLPEDAVTFMCPLRGRGGRKQKGSDLLLVSNLRQLLTYPRAESRPHLAIVFVDGDGHENRRKTLISALRDIALPHVVAVPVQEFEAWLIKDHSAVARTLKPPPDQPEAVESMAPRKAKSLLDEWISAAMGNPHPRGVRMTLAGISDLSMLNRLPAFKCFREDLKAALKIVSG